MTQICNIETATGERFKISDAYLGNYQNRVIYLLDGSDRRIGKLFVFHYVQSNLLTDDPSDEIIPENLNSPLSDYDARFSTLDTIVIRKGKAALCRLEYPLDLEDKYRKEYEAFLRKFADLILPIMIKEGDIEAIYVLRNIGAIRRENIQESIEIANKLSRIEILSLLMDFQNSTWGHDPGESLSLQIDNRSTDWVTFPNEDGSVTITRYCGNQLNIQIPSKINGKNVKGFEGYIGSLKLSIFYHHKNFVRKITIEDGIEFIGERAFLECPKLRSVVIPGSVKEIRKEAFEGCTNLKSITIPEGVTKIGDRAFSGCTSLASIVLPEGLTEIVAYVFSRCTGLTSIIIPEGVTEIHERAFYGCRKLTSIILPEGVTKIGNETFSGCTGLTSIILPEGVIEISNRAFSYCTGLTQIILPDGVTKIGNEAFSGCTGLTSIILPEGVIGISTGAFSGCTGLTSIAIPEGVTKIGWNAFSGCSNLTSVIVPAEATKIDDTAFDDCPNLTIHSPKDSYAIEYAKKNGINYEEI